MTFVDAEGSPLPKNPNYTSNGRVLPGGVLPDDAIGLAEGIMDLGSVRLVRRPGLSPPR